MMASKDAIPDFLISRHHYWFVVAILSLVMTVYSGRVITQFAMWGQLSKITITTGVALINIFVLKATYAQFFPNCSKNW
jgi:hypothetical protein